MRSPNIYLTEFNQVALQAFSMWNREPASPSFGSCDRAYWGWKKKDFSDATLQYAVKLAVEYAHVTGRTSTLPSLLEGYVDWCERIQLKDGSFDQCYPNEKTPGVIYDILSTLIYVRKSPYLVSANAQKSLDRIMERAIAFALNADEHHGEIANHIAEYAYELLYYAAHTGDDRASCKGKTYLERLLSLLEPTEGWFQEYQGPDPGYQSRTLRYLLKCAELLDEPELWRIVEQAADFVAQVLMPDGAIHPMLGTRSTALLYPSPFEILAARNEAYKGLAARVRNAWFHKLVPLPSWLDFDNAIRLADDALDAARVLNSQETTPSSENQDTHLTSVEFPKAGISIFRSPQRCVYIGYRLGGVVVVYQKDWEGCWQLVYEDSGYLLCDGLSRQAWLTRMPDSGELVESSKQRLLIRASFYRSLHDELTPGRFIMLRLLNMTVLRHEWIAELFRKVVVRHLMTGKEKIPVTLYREIVLEDKRMLVSDRIVNDRSPIAQNQGSKLYRCRRLIGTHMATSRYFQQQELEALPLDWMQEVPWLGRLEILNSIEVASSTVELAEGKL
ncbi:MAG TPA: hypothetical protein DDZ80_22915 [Cyanobacteria bacterium UBA8803]|nr:hypothetical protein [Cyanobacteria bacterium UBA9273]HBL61179.1 hypothetical protein [Cyanobacteria bacterium UBA8803]